MVRRAIALSQGNQAEAGVPSWLLLAYARALLDLRRLDEAADYAERAYAKAQTVGDQFLERALWVRTAVYCSQGDFERAAQMLSEVESVLRRNLPNGHTAFGALASQEALIAQAPGKTQTALDLANQAVAIAEASIREGREGAAYLQIFLVWRSQIQLQLGHKDEAAGDARRVLKIVLDRMQPGTFSVTLGRAYLALGRALQAQGKHEEASLAFRSAVEHLQSALGPDSAETLAARQLAQPELPVR